eukprot:TRINITY_DN553_c0_g1_i2.p1 TRINITY_DN553_c0_g1~~TRINITY_DN553_c0_g1_i2.p1  ORF type:complete len:392 (+),score=82.88 TRINITY_DN553_c0_g1_i2:190-1365(+)
MMLIQTPRRSASWRAFDGFLALFTVLLVSFLGGAANRIRGGFLSIPDWTTDPGGTFRDIMLRDLTLRLVWCLSIGLLVGIAMSEPKRSRRSHHFRRFAAGTFMAFATWCSILVGWGVYFNIGRTNTYNARIGVFDWVIGHECPDWGFLRRWAISYCGMSLRGLLQTVPAGLGLFALGYGPDYMLSGVTMGLVYEIAWDIPSTTVNIETGPPIGELLWGWWTFFILQCVVLSHRSNPISTVHNLVHKPQRSWWRRVLFYAPLSFVLAIMIGSCIGYGFVKQTDETNYGQTWLGLFSTTGLTIFILLIVITSSSLRREPDLPYDYLEIQDPPSLTHEAPLFIPSGSAPWGFLVAFIRLVSVLQCLLVFALVWITAFENRIIPSSACEIHWDST